MELINIKKNGIHELLLTGNSRIRILNDYENKLLSDKYIKYTGTSLILYVYNINKFSMNMKFYAKISYNKGIPRIVCLWDYNNFAPTYAIYPITPIKQKTLDHFNITNDILIDTNELDKNTDILNDEYENYLYFSKSNKMQRCKKLPNCDKNYSSDSEILSDNSIEEYTDITDVFAFDEML